MRRMMVGVWSLGRVGLGLDCITTTPWPRFLNLNPKPELGIARRAHTKVKSSSLQETAERALQLAKKTGTASQEAEAALRNEVLFFFFLL